MENQNQLKNSRVPECDSVYRIGALEIPCRSKKQMKALYPSKQFPISGEYAPRSKQACVDSIPAGDTELSVNQYHSNNRVAYRVIGYFPNPNGEQYTALLKNRLPQRICTLLLCLILIVGCIFALSQNSAIPSALGIDSGATDIAEDSTYNQGGSAGQSIEIPGYKSIPIQADAASTPVSFQNPKGNPCYFVISLILEDGTVLYQSDLIPPGKEVTQISLSKSLPKGEYSASVKYETYSLEDQTPLNGANVKVSLISQ